jgi:hypothetical protein
MLIFFIFPAASYKKMVPLLISYNTKLPSSTHFRCLLVALLDVLIVRLRRLLIAASVRLRMQLGISHSL